MTTNGLHNFETHTIQISDKVHYKVTVISNINDNTVDNVVIAKYPNVWRTTGNTFASFELIKQNYKNKKFLKGIEEIEKLYNNNEHVEVMSQKDRLIALKLATFSYQKSIN